MIKRIRNMSKISEKVDDLKVSFDEMSAKVGGHRDEIVGLKSDIGGLRQFQEEHSEILVGLNEQKTKYAELIADLQKEIYDFKLMKSNMQKAITEKFNSELSRCLDMQTNQLQGDVAFYNNLRRDMELISGKVVALTGEVDKFKKISKSINARDFELVKHKKNLDSMDREKLTLLKKIDNLERMVGKLRRGGR